MGVGVGEGVAGVAKNMGYAWAGTFVLGICVDGEDRAYERPLLSQECGFRRVGDFGALWRWRCTDSGDMASMP